MDTATPLRPNLKAVLGWHRPLMVNVVLMAALTLFSAVALLFDDRVLLNESVWVKPMKFGFAFTVYSLVLAWMLTLLRKGRRIGWWFGAVFAFFGTVDVAAVAFAASRGTFSHFNQDTGTANEIVQTVFAYGVPPLAVSNLVIAVIVLVQRVGDRPLAWALRAGLVLSTIGMLLPLFMLPESWRPERQVPTADGGEVAMTVGHGIGDPDGVGMPLTNWSSTGGDLRVSHFIGLHGIHVLLLCVLVLSMLAKRYAWLRDERVRALFVGVVAVCYAGLLTVTAWQALRGQSLIHPDAKTLSAAAAIAVLTLTLGAAAVAVGRHRAKRPLSVVGV